MAEKVKPHRLLRNSKKARTRFGIEQTTWPRMKVHHSRALKLTTNFRNEKRKEQWKQDTVQKKNSKKKERGTKKLEKTNGAPSCSKSTTSKEGEKRKWELGDKTKGIKALNLVPMQLTRCSLQFPLIRRPKKWKKKSTRRLRPNMFFCVKQHY